MNINVYTQAILLLTVWLSKSPKTDPKPLTPTEWGRFAQWMKEQGKTPVGVMENRSVADYLQGCPDIKITPERVEFLLGRSMAFSLVLEKWQRAGLWILTRSDPDYPSRLKAHLKADAPPVLFGCGNRKLLHKGGIAMVGSRDVTPNQLSLTETLAGTAAMQGFSIVSGGARGVDETAMLGALKKEGTVIGILADSLLRTATSAKYRSGLMSKNMVLISPFNPEAGFDVGNAMARNKYIYCLSDAAIVVATGKGSGGTWSGAVENLKKGWTPLWVCQNPDSSSGNFALVQQGASWLPEMPFDAASLLKVPSVSTPTSPLETTLFDIMATPMHNLAVAEGVEPSGYAQIETSGSEPIQTVPTTEVTSFYEFFLKRLDSVTAGKTLTVEQLLDSLDISKAQLDEWLKRGISEGRIEKLGKPIRYKIIQGLQ